MNESRDRFDTTYRSRPNEHWEPRSEAALDRITDPQLPERTRKRRKRILALVLGASVLAFTALVSLASWTHDGMPVVPAWDLKVSSGGTRSVVAFLWKGGRTSAREDSAERIVANDPCAPWPSAGIPSVARVVRSCRKGRGPTRCASDVLVRERACCSGVLEQSRNRREGVVRRARRLTAFAAVKRSYGSGFAALVIVRLQLKPIR